MYRKYREDEFKYTQLLGQKWAGRDKRLQDYACNILAHKLIVLDITIDQIQDKDVKEALKKVRDTLRRTGEALWIMNADVLTNLALKVGRTIRVVDASKE